jgi:hypothetical protein
MALFVGMAAVPLAPIAKDLASALTDALGALGKLRRQPQGSGAMADLFYLSLREIDTTSTAVTPGHIYRQANVNPATVWSAARLTGADWVPWDQIAGVFRNKRVCFVVHGFNVSVDHGVKGSGPAAQEFEALGQFALQMTNADLVVPVLWPGDGLILTSWFTAIPHSITAGGRFAELLVSSVFTASEVSFVTHSLGARVVLETVQQTLQKRANYPFDTAIFTAAAVADTTLDHPRYAAAVAGLRRIVILSSTQDTILSGVFVPGDIVENALWWDYRGNGRALGRFGPAFKAGSTVPGRTEWYAIRPPQGDDPTDKGQDHGDYFPEGWHVTPLPNGWSDKRRKVGEFVDDVVDLDPFPASLQPWATDNTGRFRAPWTPKLPPGQ